MKEIIHIRSSHSVVSEEEEAVLGLETPQKTIGVVGSISLIANNIAGPGMMSLPHVFANAGWLPTILCTLWVFIGASFCGTLLADTISSFPGNAEFNQNIEFSLAFNILAGHMWYYVAQSFFILSCMIQCMTAIVEAAHSVDGIIASLILGETYAIQLYPSLDFIVWKSDRCDMVDATPDDCIPFLDQGDFVISFGYVLVTCLFLPLGMKHLKENVLFQILAFGFFILIVLLFFNEFLFVSKLQYSVPMIGPDLGQLMGIVLFNYAYSITVPAWLTEKKEHVSVNKTIWISSFVLTIIYILFGLFGCMAYNYPPADMLSLLSSKKSDGLTRVCAAFFGVTIIGCGIPIYCVLVKNTLYAGRTCGVHGSFFWGAIFPYAAAWMMYQGTTMVSVLSWAGLVVNGVVAFLLPLVLALFTYEARLRSFDKIKKLEEIETGSTISFVKRTLSGRLIAMLQSRLSIKNIASHNSIVLTTSPTTTTTTTPISASKNDKSSSLWGCVFCNSSRSSTNKQVSKSESPENIALVSKNNLSYNGENKNQQKVQQELNKQNKYEEDDDDNDDDLVLDGSIYPFTTWLIPYQKEIILFFLISFTTSIILTIIRNTYWDIENFTDDFSPPAKSDDDYYIK